jgi:hypothetical protein
MLRSEIDSVTLQSEIVHLRGEEKRRMANKTDRQTR